MKASKIGSTGILVPVSPLSSGSVGFSLSTGGKVSFPGSVSLALINATLGMTGISVRFRSTRTEKLLVTVAPGAILIFSKCITPFRSSPPLPET